MHDGTGSQSSTWNSVVSTRTDDRNPTKAGILFVPTHQKLDPRTLT